MTDLQQLVAHSSDVLGLHANAPALVLEMQSLLGSIAAVATEGTARGRRPFRPDAQWQPALGALAYALYNLADQTGVDLDAAAREWADSLRSAQQQSQSLPLGSAWPFSAD